MKKISFLILLFIGFIGHSQCPTGNVTLNTQADVDNFQINYPNCTVIDGDLAVTGSDINDLSPLINITTVNGNIGINSNPSLTSIAGLQNIASCNNLNISLCPLLLDLNGLQALQTMTGHLVIIYNDGLQDINDLSSLTSFSGASIYSNPQLSSLNGLQGVTAAPGYLNIQDNNLTDLIGLDNLLTAGSMYIINNSGLTSLSGLENLIDVAGIFSVDNNPTLFDLSALNHTISFGSLQITQNSNLSSCAVQSVCDFVNVSSASISNNGVNCNSQTEVLNQCGMNLTKLKDIHCGEQLTTFNEVFYADAVPGATEYQFKFTDVDPPYNFIENYWSTNGHHLMLVNLLELDKTYDVQVRAKVNGVWGLYGQVCQIHSPNDVPTTQIQSAYCDIQLTSFNQVFYADLVSGATQYEFLFIDTDNILPDTYSPWTSNGHHLQIPGLLEANKTYDVQVRAYVDNTWGTFGPACQIHSPQNVPTTQLQAINCGEQLTTFNEVFYAQSVAGATQYEFKFTNTQFPFTETTNLWGGPGHTLQLLGLYDLGQTYDVQIRTQVNGVWSDWGPVCQIHSPTSIPNTNIYASDCGTTMSSYNEVFKCDAVAGADLYKFRFYDGSSYSYSDRTINTNTLTIAGLLLQNVTYQVDVMARINGVWGTYDQACPITSPPTPPTSMPGQDFDDPSESTENSNLTAGVNEDLEIELVIYPNPAREQFTLSTELEGYSIQLYSTNGQLVYSATDLSGVQSIDVSILDPGLYLLHIIDKDMLLVKTEKITVIK